MHPQASENDSKSHFNVIFSPFVGQRFNTATDLVMLPAMDGHDGWVMLSAQAL
jgi:hypothetical protein